jgi:hypothetical protein
VYDRQPPKPFCREFAVTRRPDVFIVGAPKCATSSLYRYLQSHPDVFMSTPKEPQFFAADTLVGAGLRYPHDMELYMSLFADAGDVTRVGEASTTYLESREAAARIRDFQPDARIIAMIRDPVEMIHSLHEMRVRQGVESKELFEDAIADERSRPGFGVVGDRSSVRYRDRARYGAMLPIWLDTFGRDRVHVVVTEDLAQAPELVFRRVLEFLEIDPNHVPEFERRNAGRAVRSTRLARLLARAPRRNVSRSPIEAITVRAFRLMRRANQVPGTRQPMSETLRHQLRDEFREDVAQLSALLGRDLAEFWWSGRRG